MKKSLLAGVAILVVAATAWAVTNQVSSVNVAGYVKLNIPRNQLCLIRNDFLPMGPDNTVSNIMAKQLPRDSRVYAWNPVAKNYTICTFTRQFVNPFWRTNWTFGVTTYLDVGDGFWVFVPTTYASQTNYVLNMLGEVPNNGTSNIPIVQGLNLVGYSYPVPMVLSNLDITAKQKVGDRVYKWGGSGYTIATSTRYFQNPLWKTNWKPDVTRSMQIGVGEGFWYSRTTNSPGFTWVEVQPYSLE